jgi:hypothetical protein
LKERGTQRQRLAATKLKYKRKGGKKNEQDGKILNVSFYFQLISSWQ